MSENEGDLNPWKTGIKKETFLIMAGQGALQGWIVVLGDRQVVPVPTTDKELCLENGLN